MKELEERKCWSCTKTLCYAGGGIISTTINGVNMKAESEKAVFFCKCGTMNTVHAPKPKEVVKG